ncbi:unnamed protein product [Paramecium pentaurelia]|uniref:Uncharacterized protein n=1 Tax=Paramecium pentaurelia TaxID=43138 RepID=A0A8S1WGX8_9CILI|nr:unnamed protein product [Paramecium pentaurelia]
MLATIQYNEVFQGKNKINGIEITIKIINKVFQQMYQYNYQFNLIGSKIKIYLIYLEFNALMTINANFYNSLELMNWGKFRDFIKFISYNQESQYKGLCFIQDNLEENLKLKILNFMLLNFNSLIHRANKNFENFWQEQKEMKEQPQFVIIFIIHSSQKIKE